MCFPPLVTFLLHLSCMDTSAQSQADQVPLPPPEPGCSPDQASIPFRPSDDANRDKSGITSNNKEGSKSGSCIEDDNSSCGKASPRKASDNEIASLHSKQHASLVQIDPKINKDEVAIESGDEEERLTSHLTLLFKLQTSNYAREFHGLHTSFIYLLNL